MNTKLKLAFHLLAQILVQGAVAALVPQGGEKYYAAVVAIVGVVVAFYDNQTAQQP